jgi:hypothetical protein
VHRRFQADITVGTASMGGDRFTYARANLDVPLSGWLTLGWSGIYRSIKVESTNDWQTSSDDYSNTRAYHSNTLVSAFRMRALLGHRAAVEANLSIERASGSLDGAASSQASLYFKGGVCGSFRF